MDTITLQTESFLFENLDGQFRAIPETSLDEDKFIKTFVMETDEIGFDSAYAENQEDLICLLTFIFSQPIKLTELTSNGDKEVYDLTHYKHNTGYQQQQALKVSCNSNEHLLHIQKT